MLSRGQEQNRVAIEKRDQRKAAVMAVVIFVSLVAACVYLTAFTISTPPPGEQFVAVGFADWGDSQSASGTHESETPSETVKEAVAPSEASESTQETATPTPVITQSSSDVSVPVAPEPVVEPIKPEPEPEPEPIPSVSNALSNALSSMASSGGGGSQGTSSATVPGNEGDTDGNIDGRGVVSGDFGEAQLEGGTLVGRPSLDEKPMIEGLVRIRITVNKAGLVTSTRYDPEHSDITDSDHIQLAIRAAKTATFSPNHSQPIRSGYITIRFELE